jgi:hypothetical protein
MSDDSLNQGRIPGISLEGARVRQARRLLDDLTALRHRSGNTQAQFWHQYGSSQSSGCRFELGRKLSKPVRMLMLLKAMDYITEGQLEEVARLAEKLDERAEK